MNGSSPPSALSSTGFDRATLAARVRALLACPVAVVALLDPSGGWWSATAGSGDDAAVDAAARALALQTLLHRQPWRVADTLADPLLHHHAHVLGSPWFRSLAAVPLFGSDGSILGCLCGLAFEPDAMAAEATDGLEQLAVALSRSIEQQRLTGVLRRLHAGGGIAAEPQGGPGRLVSRDLLLTGLEALFRMRAARGFSVLRLKCRDLDRFGTTISPQGTQALMATLSDRIASVLPPFASGCRYNEQEILLLLPGLADHAALASLAERLVRVISAPCRIGEVTLALKVAVGGTVVDGSQISLEVVLSEAAAARRLAAGAAGSDYRLIDAEVRRQFRDDFARQIRFRDALHQGALQPFFQPIVDLVSGRPLGFEALARWCGSDGRVQSPADFLPVASRMGLTGELDLAVLSRVLEAMPRLAASASGLPAEGEPLLMSVNLSAQLLDDADQRQRLLSLIESRAMPPGWRLQVEILEESLQESSSAFDTFLSGLAALQVGIAIDDFGTGYSSLARLDHLPIQSFKIDRSFVERIDHHLSPSNHLLRMMNSLAIEMGLGTTAEGVSTDAQRIWLQRSGFLSCQGFLFARPLPLEQALAYLSAAAAAGIAPAAPQAPRSSASPSLHRRLRRMVRWLGLPLRPSRRYGSPAVGRTPADPSP